MKSTLLFATALMASIMLQAQSSVTFLVNMQGLTISPNGVHIAGTFQSPQWQPGATAMTDTDGDDIYEYTTTVPTGVPIQFKFINGNNWGPNQDETVPQECGTDNTVGGYNRVFTPTTPSFTYGPVCFAACADCPPSPTADITFAVNMEQQTVSPNGVFVVGIPTTDAAFSQQLSDADGDGVYTGTITVDTNQIVNYRFQNGLGLADAETVPAECRFMVQGMMFRRLELAYDDTTMATVCYGECADCVEIQPQVNVTFRVNMANETVSADGVQVVGSMQNWSLGANPMTDGDGDGIYEATLSVAANDTIEFVFINGNDWPFSESVPAECGVDNGFGAYNREFTVGEIDAVYGPICFGQCIDCEPIVEPTTVNVTFRVNMANQVISAAGVHIAGNFQGWTPGASEMTDGDGDGVYEYTALIVTNTEVRYKFLNGDAWGPAEEMVPADCGSENGVGGYDRSFMLAGNDTTLQSVCFSECLDCVPVSLVIVTLNVDMTNETVTNDEVFVAGSFNNWTPEAMIPLGNALYQLPIVVNSGSLLSYKFINGTAWETVPAECGSDDMFGGYNRSVLIGNGNEEIAAVCFASCGPCVVVPTLQLTLTVDMSQQTVNTSGVFVAGTFNGFSATATQMLEIAPSIYRAVVDVEQNQQQFFKFLNGPDFAYAETVPFECGVDDGFGGYNRTVVTNESNITMPEVCFGYCAGCAIQVNEVEGTSLLAYPNPTDGMITIETLQPSALSVFNAMGQLVFSVSRQTSRVQLDTQDWSSGLYHVVDEHGSATTFIVR